MKRGAKEFYKPGLAGWNPGGKTSGFTPRFATTWMIQGAARYARFQFHRPDVPKVSSVCGGQINVG